jgi:hypothetical protein
MGPWNPWLQGPQIGKAMGDSWIHMPPGFLIKVTAQVGQAFFTVEPEIFLDSGISFRFKDS